MVQDPLNEREFELVNIVGAQLDYNQRQLSQRMNLSLGMTNMLLRRLVTKGYIRIQQLNHRKVEYLLTPKGFAEKLRKSIKYTVKTINSLGLIKKRFKELLSNHQGETIFYVLGESDFAFLVDVCLKELNYKDYKLNYVKNSEESGNDGVLCICREEFSEVSKDRKHINFVKALAEDNEFTTHSLKD